MKMIEREIYDEMFNRATRPDAKYAFYSPMLHVLIAGRRRMAIWSEDSFLAAVKVKADILKAIRDWKPETETYKKYRIANPEQSLKIGPEFVKAPVWRNRYELKILESVFKY